jgi:molybdate transport system substrate-binding protein
VISIPAVVWGSRGAAGEPWNKKEEGEKLSTLTVFAASSQTDACGELARIFEEHNPGVEVRQSFESSSTLLARIQHSAHADG